MARRRNRRHAGDAAVRRVRRANLRDLASGLSAGWHFIAHGNVDHTPCGCRTHNWIGIPAVELAWTSAGNRYVFLCLHCRSTWSIAKPDGTADDQLNVDGSHPDIRRMRAQRRANANAIADTAAPHDPLWRGNQRGIRP